MGKPSSTNPTSYLPRRAVDAGVCLLLICLAVFWAPLHAQTTRATVVPLLLPAGIAYDSAGNLYVSQATGHQILTVSPSGALTRFAGTGVQGYTGDGGPALAAQLDTPSALAVSPSGDVYLADTHNHRIRRIAAQTGMITTVAGTGRPGISPDGTSGAAALVDLPSALAFDAAGDLFFADARSHCVFRLAAGSGVLSRVAGSGVQGFSGDGGPATAAALDTPFGLAIDSFGALFIADSHNGRIRRVDPATHLITTVAGTGASSYSGDSTSATLAALHLPRGLTLDAAGNLYLADAANERVRRIDQATGVITTVAGGSTQRFAGDGSPAVVASLDTPGAITLDPSGLVTMADSANGRVRQIDKAAIIHTIAGLGDTLGAALNLSSPSTITYGTGRLTATLAASPATGNVTLLESVGGQLSTLAVLPLSANAATFDTAALPAGIHLLTATYPGDDLHSAAQSQVFTLTVAPAPVLATPVTISTLYGLPIPPLNGSLTGLLPTDASSIFLNLASAATPQSPPANYPITGALTGPAAGNYVLTVAPAYVSVAKAPALVTLGTAGAYTAHVTSTTSGTPGGAATLLDGSQTVATSALVAGFTTFNPSLSTGTHTLTAVYAGDQDFLPASSASSVVTVSLGPAPDFTLAAVGQTTQTIPAGTAASFAIDINLLNGGPPSAIQLAVSGLPAGATSSFNPAYIPPGGAVTSSILTIQTLHAQQRFPEKEAGGQLVLALLFPVLLLTRRRTRGRSAPLALLAVGILLSTMGCGDRVSTAGQAAPIQTYTLTITGTATSAAGTTLQHSTTVTLKVQ